MKTLSLLSIVIHRIARHTYFSNGYKQSEKKCPGVVTEQFDSVSLHIGKHFQRELFDIENR